jgi:hypothetical protein
MLTFFNFVFSDVVATFSKLIHQEQACDELPRYQT